MKLRFRVEQRSERPRRWRPVAAKFHGFMLVDEWERFDAHLGAAAHRLRELNERYKGRGLRFRIKVLTSALLALACSSATDEPWLFLDREELSGQNRICYYADGLGEFVVTVKRSERCEPMVVGSGL